MGVVELGDSSEDYSSGSSSEDTVRRLSTGRNDAWLTAGIIVADVVGAGILGMPVAVAKFGWVLGAILMVVLLMANVHVSILMWRVRMYSPTCCDAITYNDLVLGSFANAPGWQRYAMAGLAGFSQKSFLFGLMGLYLMSAGKGFALMFYETRICLPQWAFYAAALLFPFAATSRTMGSCQWLVWLNVITLCGTVVIPLGYYSIFGTEGVFAAGSEVKAFEDLSIVGVLSGLSTYTFGMTSQFMLMEIISEMDNPEELPKAYALLSAPFQLSMFLLAGLGGYFYMGSNVEGMMNENLPFGPALQIGAVCLLTHMLISYLIKGVVLCKSIHKAVDKKYAKSSNNSLRSWSGWVALVFLVLAVAWLFANLVPFFGDMVDLLGASLTPLSCWVIPICMYLRYYVDAEKKPHISTFEWVVLALEVLLALILMVFGTASVLRTITEDWATYGAPFDCHCQGLWNTCECSADHPGMVEVCKAN
eukprot:TRINITY_DN73012_c0_g1_i1.p1 TRINITY_DN73012_c0_g1~~TRINITY_DN73012_c0_g1_i1.p1  ORF type:complete len:503 (-),score=101.81 TRINITY_DN73012_c0_g1_i1:331-1761(-)